MSYFVYILLCSDKTFYVGCTNNLEIRFDQHQTGVDPNSYTFRRRPVKLVYFEEFQSVRDAVEREHQLHGWSRKKRIALIKNNQKSILNFSSTKNNQKGSYSRAQIEAGLD